MTTEEARETLSTVLRYTHIDCDYGYDNADGTVKLVPGKDIADALEMAITALRAQQETENHEPLTLDDLRQMDGKPIWVIPLEKDPDWEPHWYVIYDGQVGAKSSTRKGVMYFYYHENYRKKWLAYRCKPKEGA